MPPPRGPLGSERGLLPQGAVGPRLERVDSGDLRGGVGRVTVCVWVRRGPGSREAPGRSLVVRESAGRVRRSFEPGVFGTDQVRPPPVRLTF